MFRFQNQWPDAPMFIIGLKDDETVISAFGRMVEDNADLEPMWGHHDDREGYTGALLFGNPVVFQFIG